MREAEATEEKLATTETGRFENPTYLPVGREETLDAALELVEGCVQEIWSVEADDVRLARALAEGHGGLGARDLLHLACCIRREVSELRTFDGALAAAWRAP